ncbi:signal peptidase I [Arthrobacter sp. PGP41]|uniref:signal peptidase I n=1 Tax=Arthrobacter sp. PGP41 TaxID=2079227 RepID=UPI000CDBC741|nr:signal peptidase I [Arthrobacter sp. PGP41]AUZ34920.1 signal peptidase I [Arthrobacter sp. PGP41]
MTAAFTQDPPCATTAASSAAAPAVGRWAKALRPTARAASTLMMLGAVAAFLFLAVGPRVLGYQTSTMLTGSMAPLINAGDVVVSVPKPVSSLKTGDIITYGIPVEDHRVETHRIIEIVRKGDGTTTVRTKGDANNGADPWTAALQGGTVHVHAATIPYLGSAIRALREPVLLQSLVYGAPAVLVAMVLLSIWKTEPSANSSSPSQSTADGHLAAGDPAHGAR